MSTRPMFSTSFVTFISHVCPPKKEIAVSIDNNEDCKGDGYWRIGNRHLRMF